MNELRLCAETNELNYKINLIHGTLQGLLSPPRLFVYCSHTRES